MTPPTTPGIEVRSIPLEAAQPSLTERGIEGYLAVFNQRASIGDPKTFGFYEEIAPGAFAKTIAEQDQRSLFNHDPNYPLARRSVGTLQLSEDERGLKFAIPELPDTSYARDLRENIRNGNIAGSSFQFSVAPGGQSWREEGGADVRTLSELSMLEGGPVTFPAYEGTDVALRDAVSAARAGAPAKPYGDVEYADPGYQTDKKKRYPIDSAAHVKAAWSYINQAKNAGAYSADQLASVKSKIQAAAKKFGVDIQANAAPPTGEHRTDAEPDADDDPGQLAASIDATLDEAADEHAQGNDDQAWALVAAAETVVDQLLALLGVADADEKPDTGSTSAPRSTAGNGEVPPSHPGRRAYLQRQLRAKALAAIHNLES